MNPPTQTLTQDEDNALRESLKRCSAETIEAAIEYRRTRDAALANTIVIGILARFLEPEQRAKLAGDADHLRLMDDLGVDSLTMVEVVMLVEEVLVIHIENEELRNLRTLGDVKAYVNAVARGLPPPAPPVQLDVAQIADAMPQQPPFLFLQTAELRASEARGTFPLTGDPVTGEGFFPQGHFKDRPVFPASLQLEALGQLGVLLLLKGGVEGVAGEVDPNTIFFTSCNGVRCTRVCRPGDTLTLSLRPKRVKHPVAVFEGTVTVNGEKAAFAEEITLTFDYKKAVPAAATADSGANGANGASPAAEASAADANA